MNLFSVVFFSIGFLVLLIVTQDLHIFPGAFTSKAKFWKRNRKPPPPVESFFVTAQDQIKLEVWRYPAERETDLSQYKAIIFHGNGGPVDDFLFVQMWLSDLGIASYNFDYRGYGRSDGWPGERGIYSDSDAVYSYLLKKENVDSSRILIIGISVGSGPAARIASMHSPKLLLLASAFTDLRSTIRAQPLIGFLAPFVRHKFPTIDYVKTLTSTDLLIAHARNDRIVPWQHSIELEAAYQGSGNLKRLLSEESGHNLAFFALKRELKETLLAWL